ncbi:MAG: hypothetical protein EBU96_06820 [Actinobacteria bacterium]|nr:hypothetical protein [Actinomycetota bacterium]
MKFLQSSIFLIALIMSTAANALNPPFVALDTYASNHDGADASSQIYVTSRCIALFITFAAQSSNQNNPTAKTFTNNARNASQSLTTVVEWVITKTSIDPKAAIAENKRFIKDASAKYMQWENQLLAAGHSLENDPLVNSDTQFCANLTNAVRAKQNP